MTDKDPPRDSFDAAITQERLVPLAGGDPEARTDRRGPVRSAPLERTPDPPLVDPYAGKPAPPPAAVVRGRGKDKAAPRTVDPPPEEISAPPKRRWGKAALIVLAVALSLLGFAGTYAALNWDGLVQGSVERQAKSRGFGIRVGKLSSQGLVPWDGKKPEIVLENVKLTSQEQGDLEIDVELLTIQLEGTFPSFEPKSIAAKGVFISSPNVPALVALERDAKQGELSKTPFKLSDVRLRVASLSEAVPATVVGKASEITGSAGEIRFADMTLEVPIPFVDLTLGPASADVTRKEGQTKVVFDDLKAVTLALDDEAKKASVQVAPLSSSVVDKLLGIALPTMTVSGSASLAVAGKDAPNGSFNAVLDGFVPPHPKELNGIVFGGKTKVSSNFRLSDDAVALDNVAIEAGSFKLKGTGKVTLGEGGALSLDLKGSVPCSELAISAISSHLGTAAGLLTRGLASGRLGGTVSVHVTVEAKLNDLEHAKVVPSAYIGCKVSL